MTGSRVDRNSVFFRFASEGHVLETIEFYGKEIAVGDLKQQIAEKKNLLKSDLVLVNDMTKEVYARDGAMVARNVSVTVRRTPVLKGKKPLVVVEDLDAPAKPAKRVRALPNLEVRTAVERKPCPPTYLCPLCKDIFDNPHIARCCGRSACGHCVREWVEECPLCKKPWTEMSQPIKNLRLAEIVSSLDLDYFELPEHSRFRLAQEDKVLAAPPLQSSAAPEGSSVQLGARSPAASSAAKAESLSPEPDPLEEPLPGPAGGHPFTPPPARSWPPPMQPPPVPGMVVLPSMLTPEQFHAWQQSLQQDVGSESDSSGRNRRRGRRRHSKEDGQDRSERRRRRRTRSLEHAERRR